MPAGVGRPAKHVTDNVGKTATGAVDNVYYTAGAATKGVQGTVSKTTGAIGKGDAKGAVRGASSGVGTFFVVSFLGFLLAFVCVRESFALYDWADWFLGNNLSSTLGGVGKGVGGLLGGITGFGQDEEEK